MDKELQQITFEFSDEEPSGDAVPEFLSGAPVPPAPKPKEKRGRKSLKEAAEDAENVQVPEDAVLDQKKYYGIGEVAAMFGVNGSLLRFWEAEFGLVLRKNRKGDRFFTPSDIRTVQLIHDLVRRRKFTIEGARDYLSRNKQADARFEMIRSLQSLRNFLSELKAGL